MISKFLLALIVTITSTISPTLFDSRAIPELNTPEETAIYFSKNIDLVNDYFYELGFMTKVTSVEGKYDVFINDLQDKNVGLLLDFNGKNGYILVGENAAIYDYKPYGEAPLHNLDSKGKEFEYIPFSGYYYSVGEGLISVTSINSDDYTNYEFGSPYNGQELDGAGGIRYPEDYIDDRYGLDYILYSSKSLNYTTNYSMQDLSIYYHNGFTEGNCGLVAPFNVMNYLSSRSAYPLLPNYTDRSSYDPSVGETALYYSRLNDPTYIIASSNLVSMPNLYINARTTAYQKYNKVESFTIGVNDNIELLENGG